MKSYFGFMAATLVVLLIPGVGVTYVATHSIGQRCRARLLSVLGLIYTAMALITDSAYAILAASIGSRYSGGLLRGSMLGYVSGSVFLVLGVYTALISRQH